MDEDSDIYQSLGIDAAAIARLTNWERASLALLLLDNFEAADEDQSHLLAHAREALGELVDGATP